MPVPSTGCRTMKGPGRYGPLTGRSAAKDIPAMQEVATNASAIRYFTAIPRPRSNDILGQELSWTVADLSHPTDLAHRSTSSSFQRVLRRVVHRPHLRNPNRPRR